MKEDGPSAPLLCEGGQCVLLKAMFRIYAASQSYYKVLWLIFLI